MLFYITHTLFNVDIYSQIVSINVHKYLHFMNIYPYFKWYVWTVCIDNMHVSFPFKS